MNPYEQKQAARRERLADRATRKQEEAAGLFRKAEAILAPIPPGQPILVGHHSERRHRRDLARHDSAMRGAIEAQNQAADLARRATAPSRAISSDDPEALEKLRRKVERLQGELKRGKAVNKAWRAYQKNPQAPATLRLLDALEPAQAETVRTFVPEYSWDKGPVPGFAFTNTSAEIRRCLRRIDQLEARAAKAAEQPAPEPITGRGYRIEEDRADNRLLFIFDGKPAADVRQELRANGFKWSPTRTAWVRQLNDSARFAAGRVRRYLDAA